MKIIKTMCTLASVAILTSSINSFNGHAEENSDCSSYNSNDMAIVNMEDYNQYISSLDETEKQAMTEKYNAMLSLQNQPVARAVTKISLPGTFIMYQQADDNYCIPACVQSALKYINGSSPSQETIYDDMMPFLVIGGVAFSDIPEYMNEKIDQHYMIVSSPNKDTMLGCISYDIQTDKIPPFLRIEDSSGSYWQYSTDGHCVLSNAFYSDQSKVQIADPLGGLVSGVAYYYEKTATQLNNACTTVAY